MRRRGTSIEEKGDKPRREIAGRLPLIARHKFFKPVLHG
jgi:hypothetical protein